MQNLFFLGIISVGKEKIQYKNKNNQSITFCCGDCRNRRGGRAQRGWRQGDPQTSRSRAEPQERGGWPGAQAAAGGQKGKRVQGFSAVENSEKTKIGTHAVSSSPTNYISKMCSGASKVLATSFISLFTPKLSLKLRTQRNEA